MSVTVDTVAVDEGNESFMLPGVSMRAGYQYPGQQAMDGSGRTIIRKALTKQLVQKGAKHFVDEAAVYFRDQRETQLWGGVDVRDRWIPEQDRRQPRPPPRDVIRLQGNKKKDLFL